MALKLPHTIFSGTTGPSGDRPGPDTVAGRLAMYAAFVVFLPVYVLVYGTWIALNQWARLPYWVPLSAGGVLLVVGGLFGGLSPDVAMFFVDGYIQWAADAGFPFDNLGEHLPRILLGQLWPSILIGTVLAGLGATWKWLRRPRYKEMFIVPGPVLKARAKKTAQEISQGVNSPTNGITLGVAFDTRDERFAGGKPGARFGDRVVITDAELAGHTFVVGGSGAGKTQTMLAGLRDVMRRGHGVVFIDCKGGPDVPEQIAEWANRYGREFLHWTIQDPNREYAGPADRPAYYDPISRGDASRRKDLLIGAMRWDVEYYKSVISNYMQTLFTVKDLVPPLEGTDNFTDVSDLLSPASLIHRARYIAADKHPELAATLNRLAEIEDGERSGIRNMYARLHTITSSTAGAWLRSDPQGQKDIDLRKVAHEGQVVVFSLDTSNYEETAGLIAGLIVQDLKTLSSELRHDPAPAPLHVYVDEFSAVDTTNLLGLLAKARDAQMPCTLATQALADLARREPTFTDQVLGIVSSFVIHRANAEGDARIYAGLSGVARKTVSRTSIEESNGAFGVMGAAAATGTGYLEERDEYAVRVGAFQELQRGQAIFIAKSPHARYVNPVHVIVEDPMIPDAQRDPAVEIARPAPRVMPEREPRPTYPHPTAVALGQAKAPTSTPAVAEALERTVTGAAPAAPVRPSRPSRPVRPGDPATPTGPGNPVGRPAGAPMPTLRPQAPKPAPSSEFRPDEWSGIP